MANIINAIINLVTDPKIHLKNYLASRTDDNPALFVSLLHPYNRLEISGVEITHLEMGKGTMHIGIKRPRLWQIVEIQFTQ